MTLVVAAFPNYPPDWATFTANVSAHGPWALGFKTNAAKVNRFAARYRAAKCFRAVVFAGLTQTTADGYSALCGLLLHYSAFEHFLSALPLDFRNTTPLLSAAESSKVIAHVRTLDSGNALFAFIRPHLNRAHQRQVDRHLAGSVCNPFYLASSIRHLFAHGVLTPSPAGVTIASVATVSRYLSTTLIYVMDREFRNRMRAFRQAHP